MRHRLRDEFGTWQGRLLMPLGLLLSLAQAACWAVSTVALRQLTTRLDVMLINGIRAALALLFILPAVFISGSLGDYAMLTPLRLIFLIGSVIIGGVIGDAFYLTALRTLGVARAFPISNSYPLFTVLFSVILLDSTITARMILGMFIVLVGVYLIARPAQPASQQQEPLSSRALLKGVAGALVCAMLWGLATVVLSLGLRDQISPFVASSVRVAAVAGLSFSAGIARGHGSQLKTLSRHAWFLLSVGGIVGWGLAGNLYAAAIQYAGPSLTAIVGATAPMFAVPLSWLLLGERPARLTLLGTVVSIAGIILVI
jgi:drug/metabolite transporter (DMT)-like permease